MWGPRFRSEPGEAGAGEAVEPVGNEAYPDRDEDGFAEGQRG